jgi:hypothetical protein
MLAVIREGALEHRQLSHHLQRMEVPGSASTPGPSCAPPLHMSYTTAIHTLHMSSPSCTPSPLMPGMRYSCQRTLSCPHPSTVTCCHLTLICGSSPAVILLWLTLIMQVCQALWGPSIHRATSALAPQKMIELAPHFPPPVHLLLVRNFGF